MLWLVLVILASQEAEIRRIAVRGQPRQKVSKTTFQLIKWAHGMWTESVNKETLGPSSPGHKCKTLFGK
jgi:hypothetical protein